MIERVTDPAALRALLEANAPDWFLDAKFDPKEWCAGAICLRIENDLAIFERRGPDTLEGHIFFASRGKLALDRARAILGGVFASGCQTIIGKTPARCKAALGFTAKLGFKRIGTEHHPKDELIVAELTANSFTAEPVA